MTEGFYYSWKLANLCTIYIGGFIQLLMNVFCLLERRAVILALRVTGRFSEPEFWLIDSLMEIAVP